MTKSKARSEMSRPELYAMIDELQETIAIVAERIRDGSLALRTPSDGVQEAVAVLKSYWMGRYWDGVTDQDRERIDAAFSTLTPERNRP